MPTDYKAAAKLMAQLYYSTILDPPKLVETLEVVPRTEPLLGWRMWRIIKPGFLASAVRDFIWEPMAPTSESEDLARNLTLGVYAFKNKYDALSTYWTTLDKATVVPAAIGTVWLWGTVVEHDLGYRAQYGYPADLYVSPALDAAARENISGRYSVPISTWDQDIVEMVVDAEMAYSAGFNPFPFNPTVKVDWGKVPAFDWTRAAAATHAIMSVPGTLTTNAIVNRPLTAAATPAKADEWWVVSPVATETKEALGMNPKGKL